MIVQFEADLRCIGDCDYCPCMFLDRDSKWRCSITEDRIKSFNEPNKDCPLIEVKDE